MPLPAAAAAASATAPVAAAAAAPPPPPTTLLNGTSAMAAAGLPPAPPSKTKGGAAPRLPLLEGARVGTRDPLDVDLLRLLLLPPLAEGAPSGPPVVRFQSGSSPWEIVAE